MRIIKLRLLALIFGAIGNMGAQAAIPRFRGTISPQEEKALRGMQYAPEDRPLQWLASGELVVAHLERYSAGDVYASTCAGSGIYTVDTRSSAAARALAVGPPACGAVQTNLGAAIDPTGNTLIYSVSVEPNNSRLVRFRFDSQRVDTIATGCLIYQEQPAFGLSGRRVATKGLCRTRDGSYEVYLMNADGSGVRRLGGPDTANHESPSWSPKADSLVYVRRSGPTERSKNEIVVSDSVGTRAVVLTRGIAPAWSPSRGLIAFLAPDLRSKVDCEIHLIRSDGSGERLAFRNVVRSTFSRGWGPMFEGRVSGPLVWSPDGTELAFARAYDRGTEVWAVSIMSGSSRRLTRSVK